MGMRSNHLVKVSNGVYQSSSFFVFSIDHSLWMDASIDTCSKINHLLGEFCGWLSYLPWTYPPLSGLHIIGHPSK